MRTYLLSLLFCIVLSPSNGMGQDLSPKEEAIYIGYLDSTDLALIMEALSKIEEHHVTAAIPALEENMWDQRADQQYWFLHALWRLGSPNTLQIARAFVETTYTESFKAQISFRDTLQFRVDATEILLDLGDYSTVSSVFKILQRDTTSHYGNAVRLLDDIATKIPELSDSVAVLLRRVAVNDINRLTRWTALTSLIALYGDEAIPTLINTANNDPEPSNRIFALRKLIELDYNEIQSLLRQRLFSEPEPVYRTVIVDTLLLRFGSPSDLHTVQEYLNWEQDPIGRSLTTKLLDLFEPPLPIDTTSIEFMIDDLVSTKHSVAALNWLSDGGFVDELDNDLESAKNFIRSGDSVQCAVQITRFQGKVTSEYNDTTNEDSRFVTEEGRTFLYNKAKYILDRLPVFSMLSEFSVFAFHSAYLEQNSEIRSGGIGVNEAGSPPFLNSDVELTIGIGTVVSSHVVKANRIKIKDGGTVNSDVYYNDIENNGTISGQQITPLTLPLVASLPEFKTGTPGSTNITVPQDGQQVLSSGSYGDILVRRNGTLTLTGGAYDFNSFNTGDNVRVVFQAPSEVRIAQKFDSDQGSYIGPEDTTSMTADQIVFYIGGINGSNGNMTATPKAAQIGIANTVKANFYVPNGTLWIRQNSQVTGAFIGKDVDVGIGVKVWLKSAF